MKCPKCGSEKLKVTHTRKQDDGEETYIVRYRRCVECGSAFKTREQYSFAQPDEW